MRVRQLILISNYFFFRVELSHETKHIVQRQQQSKEHYETQDGDQSRGM
jgi:hypothetical protein